jgi:hypothetical protein
LAHRGPSLVYGGSAITVSRYVSGKGTRCSFTGLGGRATIEYSFACLTAGPDKGRVPLQEAPTDHLERGRRRKRGPTSRNTRVALLEESTTSVVPYSAHEVRRAQKTVRSLAIAPRTNRCCRLTEIICNMKTLALSTVLESSHVTVILK